MVLRDDTFATSAKQKRTNRSLSPAKSISLPCDGPVQYVGRPEMDVFVSDLATPDAWSATLSLARTIARSMLSTGPAPAATIREYLGDELMRSTVPASRQWR